MAITQEFLSQCTDKQIERGVEWTHVHNFYKLSDMSSGQMFECNLWLSKPDEYCTSPSKIMPIAFANEISLVFDGMPMAATEVAFDGPFCSVGLSSSNTNPLRAICECYILMMVAK